MLKPTLKDALDFTVAKKDEGFNTNFLAKFLLSFETGCESCQGFVAAWLKEQAEKDSSK